MELNTRFLEKRADFDAIAARVRNLDTGRHAGSGIAQECERLAKRLCIVFPADDVCGYADFRSDDLVMHVMVIGYGLQEVRQRLDKAGLHIYSETKVRNAGGELIEIIIELLAFSVTIKMVCIPELIEVAA